MREAGRIDALLVLVAHYLPNLDCSGGDRGAASAADYDRWIGQLIGGLGASRAAVVMEPGAVAADCFGPRRAALLRRNVRKLADAGHFVYVDAGHSGWRTPAQMADRLHSAGISYAEGFAVNVANRQTTAGSQRWAAKLSDLVGGREAVIDTSRNGLGPPPGDEWCNPSRQGLGQRPTTSPDLPGVAALLWIKRPGESDGDCAGERAHRFAPRQARGLVVNADWVPADVRWEAAAAELPRTGMRATA